MSRLTWQLSEESGYSAIPASLRPNPSFPITSQPLGLYIHMVRAVGCTSKPCQAALPVYNCHSARNKQILFRKGKLVCETSEPVEAVNPVRLKATGLRTAALTKPWGCSFLEKHVWSPRHVLVPQPLPSVRDTDILGDTHCC